MRLPAFGKSSVQCAAVEPDSTKAIEANRGHSKARWSWTWNAVIRKRGVFGIGGRANRTDDVSLATKLHQARTSESNILRFLSPAVRSRTPDSLIEPNSAHHVCPTSFPASKHAEPGASAPIRDSGCTTKLTNLTAGAPLCFDRCAQERRQWPALYRCRPRRCFWWILLHAPEFAHRSGWQCATI